MAKTVPISVRISQEDAEFIANLQMENAVTPSDKIRSIIAEARKQNERIVSYEGCLKTARETLRALAQKVTATEMAEKQHSELVTVFNDWIGEAFAYVASAKHELDKGEMDLKQLEEDISERVFRLFDVTARMGVTAKAPCYDKEIMTTGFAPILELTQIINQRIEKESHHG